MDYGIPLHWPEVNEKTFEAALEYVRDWRRTTYDVIVYEEARTSSHRAFAIQTVKGERYYLHPDLLDAMGSNALNELVRESQELGIYDE